MTRAVAAEREAELLDRELCYRALRTRDARFDGRFYTAVVSTGIYCRPVCPARTPKLENCLFVPSAAAAQTLGFRPCLRCRPEAAPGTAVARGSINTVTRALHLISEGGLSERGIEAFSDRLGVGARQLRRLFEQHVGASPIAVAQTQRLLLAKQLLTETSLPMTQVALAAGFGSVRRFNDVFARTYARAPSSLRKGQSTTASEPAVEIKLPYNAPYAWQAMLDFLGPRAIPGVELVEDGAYRRSFQLGSATGTLAVRADGKKSQLRAQIRLTDISVLGAVIARLRRLFDLDADSCSIDAQLARDPALAPRVRAQPGLRVPGAWDGFELAVRAVLGQQVSVQAAKTFAARLVEAHGPPLPAAAQIEGSGLVRLFPSPEVLARADLTGIGLTSARSRTLRELSAALCSEDGAHWLQPTAALPEMLERLRALPGVGEWTAQYIAMRALREPDAFPAADLGLQRALEKDGERPSTKQLEQRSQAWRPFRAYAALRLWSQ